MLFIAGPGPTPHAGGLAETKRLFDERRSGWGYLVLRRDRGFVHADKLDNVVICGRPDGGLVVNGPINEHFTRHGTRYEVVMFERPADQLAAFEVGRCDALAIYEYYDMARAERYLDAKTHIALPLEP